MVLKRLEMADTLGLTAVLCIDKTAVQSPSAMRVTDLWMGGGEWQTTLEMQQEKRAEEKMKEIITVMSVCNKSRIDEVTTLAKVCAKTPSFREKKQSGGLPAIE